MKNEVGIAGVKLYLLSITLNKFFFFKLILDFYSNTVKHVEMWYGNMWFGQKLLPKWIDCVGLQHAFNKLYSDMRNFRCFRFFGLQIDGLRDQCESVEISKCILRRGEGWSVNGSADH